MIILEIMVPFILASYGGLYSELGGFTNVSLEGYMTLGGFLFIFFAKVTNSISLSILLSIFFIIIFAGFHSFLTIILKAKEIITGLAFNMLVMGLVSALSYYFFKTKGVIQLQSLNINRIPLYIITIILPVVSWIIIYKTVYGLRLRTMGIDKKILIYSKVNINFYRITSSIIAGVFSGLAGMYLAIGLRSYTPNLAGGRGWIALVIIFLGNKNPIGILISSLIFSISLYISNINQGGFFPPDIVLAMPYIITLGALIFSSFGKKIIDSVIRYKNRWKKK